MILHVTIPDGLDADLVRRLEKEVRKFVGGRLYQEGKLSHGKLSKFLGIDRGQIDELLARYDVADEFSAREISNQVEISQQVRHSNQK